MLRIGLLNLLTDAEPVLAIVAFAIMLSKGQVKRFPFLGAFLGIRGLSSAALLGLLLVSGKLAPTKVIYPWYFYTYWVSYTLETLLGFGIVYSVFRHAMAPLKGLQSLGSMMFRWALGISVMVSITMGLSAHTSSAFIVKALMQLEQAQSVLTLCMLLFVTLAIRPMGLSYGSKLFGVNLGLGVLASADLLFTALGSQSALAHGFIPIANELVVCLALGIWTTYFALPEPRRRMILLPTTSPFLRWNQISMALGDAPGFVAVGDVTLDMFAPAELEIMRRASAKMTPSPAATGTSAAFVNRVLATPRELAETKQRLSS